MAEDVNAARADGARPSAAVWSADDRSAECGAATTISSCAQLVGVMSTVPSARMFASIALDQPKRRVSPVQRVDLAMLLRQLGHRDAAGDRRPYE